jgi:hypothetical protein
MHSIVVNIKTILNADYKLDSWKKINVVLMFGLCLSGSTISVPRGGDLGGFNPPSPEIPKF